MVSIVHVSRNHAFEKPNLIGFFLHVILKFLDNKMDVAEWKKRYQEVLATVENVYIKTQSEAEKSQKGK